MIEKDQRHVEFAVSGNGCEPIVTVDVVQGEPAVHLRVRLHDWQPQGLQCPDLLTSYPITVTFARTTDPGQLRIDLDDRRTYPSSPAQEVPIPRPG